MDQRSNVTEAAEHMAKISLRGSSMGKVNKKKTYPCPFCLKIFNKSAVILKHIYTCSFNLNAVPKDKIIKIGKPTLKECELAVKDYQCTQKLAAISVAAIGYYKRDEPIDPDWDSVALTDVCNLYAKYSKLYKEVERLKVKLRKAKK